MLEDVRSREGRVEQYSEEGEDRLAHSFHSNLLSGKLRQAVRRATDCKGGGGVFSQGCLHEDRVISCIRPLGEIPRHACTPCGKIHVHSIQGVLGGSGNGVP